jgi:hypothetical protein
MTSELIEAWKNSNRLWHDVRSERRRVLHNIQKWGLSAFVYNALPLLADSRRDVEILIANKVIENRLRTLISFIQHDRTTIDAFAPTTFSPAAYEHPKTLSPKDIDHPAIIDFIHAYRNKSDHPSWCDTQTSWIANIGTWSDRQLVEEVNKHKVTWEKEYNEFWASISKLQGDADEDGTESD